MTTVPYALTTKEKVKEYVGIQGTEKDALIDSLINYVTDFIESYTGRRFLETTYTNEEYDLPNGHIVFLKQFPVTNLASAQYRTGTIASPVWVDFDENDYLLYGEAGYIRFASSLANLTFGLQRVLRFTYTAGFKIDFANELDPNLHTLPFDITMVATQLVSRLLNLRTAEGIASERTEGQDVSYIRGDIEKQLTVEQKTILEKYKNVRLTV